MRHITARERLILSVVYCELSRGQQLLCNHASFGSISVVNTWSDLFVSISVNNDHTVYSWSLICHAACDATG